MTVKLKSCTLVLVGSILTEIALLGLAGCGSSAGSGSNPPPISNPDEWTWIGGGATIDQQGTYGTRGLAAVGNAPGARDYPVSWTDASGNFWLFGGYGFGSTEMQGDLNDLWEYSGGKWKWVSGSSQTEQSGNCGTKGAPSPGNVPGARYQAVSWIDPSGSLWLFGGLGLDCAGIRGDLNDLWRYSNGEWTWMAGAYRAAESNGQPGSIYGTKGKAAPENTPGARVDASSWSDAEGNLWLFGGAGGDSTGTLGVLNDLWKFSNGEWTWMSGSNIGNQYGVYGTEGVTAAENVPGGRGNAITWIDADGNLWLFGGDGNDSNGIVCEETVVCELNDLWEYRNGEWTWMGGSNIADAPGVYGTQGAAAPDNFPGARWGAVGWTDQAGNFWLFGGNGFDSTTGTYTVFDDLNDLWKYSGGQWTWVSGSDKAAQLGIYGSQGVHDPGNVPGARASAVGWTDLSGNLWLFGGDDIFSISPSGKLNDLWEFHP